VLHDYALYKSTFTLLYFTIVSHSIVSFRYVAYNSTKSSYDVMLYFRDTVKPFVAPEMIFRGHSRSSVMSYFVRSPALSIRDRKR